LELPNEVLKHLSKFDQIILNSDSEDSEQWHLKININKTLKIIELEEIRRPKSALSGLIIINKQKTI